MTTPNPVTPPRENLFARILAQLHRSTTSGLYIPEIDGLRTVAILVVICVHLNTFIVAQNAYPHPCTLAEMQFQFAVTRGFIGVDLFFALSGFIIALPFAAHFLRGTPKVNIGRFYLRRLTRLEPPYIVNLLMNFGIQLLLVHQPLWYLLQRLAASMTYSHNQIFGSHSPINGVGWSLEVEFQFYFLAPLFLFVFAVRPAWLRRGILAAIPLAIVCVRPDAFRIHNSLPGKVEYFATGLLLADVYLTAWKARLPRLGRLDIVAVIGWIAFGYLMTQPEETWVMCARPISLFVMMVGTVGSRWVSVIFRNRWVAAIGGMCYTIYLYHATVMGVVVRLTKRFTVTDSYVLTYCLQFAINAVVILLVSSVLFLLFEKPFMQRDWPRKFREFFALRRKSREVEPA